MSEAVKAEHSPGTAVWHFVRAAELSREPQNREEKLVSVDLHRSGSPEFAAVIQRRHLLYDNACTDETIKFNLRWAVVAICRARPCQMRLRDGSRKR